MRLFLAFLFLPTLATAQKFTVAFADYPTKLYRKAYFYRELPSIPDSMTLPIKNGALLICYNPLPANKGDWYKVIQGKDTGYVMGRAITVNTKWGYPLAELDPTNEAANYAAGLAFAGQYRGIEEKEAEKLMIADRKDSLEKDATIKTILNRGLGILEYSFPSDDYSAGLRISFINTSKQTIKYIWVTVTGFNAVDDPLGTKTVQCVGPIKPEATASYEFETVFYTRVFDWGRLAKIKVQYMNGSVKEFAGKAVGSIIY